MKMYSVELDGNAKTGMEEILYIASNFIEVLADG